MTGKKTYIVVSPVRNEAKHLPLTIDSMLAQTIRPVLWVIVNDGSKDETGQIAEAAAKSNPWIKVVSRPDRGFRKAGGGVVEAFYAGYRLIEDQAWDYLVKLDGDLSFSPDYFEKCFARFEEHARLGIAGGTICRVTDGGTEPEAKADPKFHVRGATKIYRSACWDGIGGLIPAPGWDTLDEIKANMLGWETRTLPDLHVIHHRPTGAAYGTWNDRVKAGLANYISGYHPLFMLLKCAKRTAERPYLIGGLGLLYGFVKGYLRRIGQVEDKALIRYLRQQQMNRLLGRKSLWG
ncbi:MAG: glycosyltransferase family 2 protein [Verrucomicrobia bacterium]|nr:glycosyltransferase family 2 protein [Verrucomicrobiota bacterium]